MDEFLCTPSRQEAYWSLFRSYLLARVSVADFHEGATDLFLESIAELLLMPLPPPDNGSQVNDTEHVRMSDLHPLFPSINNNNNNNSRGSSREEEKNLLLSSAVRLHNSIVYGIIANARFAPSQFVAHDIAVDDLMNLRCAKLNAMHAHSVASFGTILPDALPSVDVRIAQRLEMGCSQHECVIGGSKDERTKVIVMMRLALEDYIKNLMAKIVAEFPGTNIESEAMYSLLLSSRAKPGEMQALAGSLWEEYSERYLMLLEAGAGRHAPSHLAPRPPYGQPWVFRDNL